MQRLRRAIYLLLAAVSAALDLWSKALWDYRPPALKPTDRILVEGWFFIRAVWNDAGAWSVRLPGWLLLAGTVVAVPAIVLWIFWPRRAGAWDSVAKALVLGGAVGNLVDRWQWGKVRDWIDVWLWGWHYPTFNVADVALVGGIAILLLGGLRKGPAEAA